MADLTGKTIANTYKDLLQTGTSGTGLPQDAPVAVQDGEGKSSGLFLSQNQIDLTGTVKIKGTELTANVSALNAVADFTAVSGFATGNGAGTIVGRTFSASTGISITNADGISGRPTFSLAQSGVTSGTYSGQTGLFDVDNTGRITAVNTTDTVSVNNVNTVNLSATTADFSGNVSIGGTLTMSGAISPSSVSTTGDINGVNFNASGDISATALNVGGTVSAVDYYGDGSNLTGIVATSATNASYAASAGEAQTAVSASHAVSADFAASANNATFAITATNASFAASATNATNATSAVFASSATNATNAINVDYGGVVETSTANIGSVSASNIFVDGNVSVGGTFDVSGAVSIGGGLFVVGDVSAGNIHAGGIIYGNGAGLFNVPSEQGGTVNFVEAGNGLHNIVDGTTTTDPITASGTIALDLDQTFGAVSASSLAISSSASFADSAVLNFGNSDDLTIQHNGIHSVIKESGTGDLYIQSNRIRLANTGASDMLTLADGQDAEFPFGVQVSGTVSATSFVGPTITSIGNRITSVTDYATSITAVVSSTMATSIANHLPLSGGTLTGTLTLNGSPSANLEAATKQYVDNLTAAAIHFHEAVRVESPDSAGSLNATYDNGTAGVGATLTNAGTQAALVIDGVTLNTSDRVLIYNQTDATQNGVYTVTDTGSASTNWVLTRATDADSYEPNDNNGLDGGSYFYVEEGNTGAGEAYVCNNVGTITFGTTDITFVQFSSALVYTAGSGININGSRVVSTSGVPTDADLTALSATMATSINNTNTNVTALSATMATSIASRTSAITVNTNAITSINTVVENLSATFATSINNRTTAITALSATMAASIASRTSAITALSATMASSIANQATDSRVDALSATLATSIGNQMPKSGGTFTGNVNFGDDVKAIFGAGSDLQIYHDGNNSVISEGGTGSLYINATDLNLRSYTGFENFATFTTNGAATLYYDNAAKLATKSDGVDITGELQADSLDIDGAGDISGNLTLGGNLDMSDNDKILLGTSDDLQIFHDASHSYIQDTSTGDLRLTSNGSGVMITKTTTENMARFLTDGAVELYYDNSKKLATKSDGVDITGELQADSLDIDGAGDISGNLTLSGTGAIKVPVGTTAQRPTAAQGQIRYNTTDSNFEGYDGSDWGAIGGDSGETSLILYEYTATSGQTTFSGADDNSATLSYTVDNIQVVMNGVILDPSDYTATNGTSVVLDAGAASGDLVNIYAFKSFTVADTVPASAGGTFSGNIAITGNLTVDTNTLQVDASNNRVGIGTASPNANTKLDVNGAARIGNSTDGIMIENNSGAFDISNAAYIRRNSSSGDLELTSGSTTARNMIFNTGTSGSESMRLNSSGNLGLGTSDNMDERLVVQGSSIANSMVVARSNNTNNTGKYGFFSGAHYTNSEEPVAMIASESNASNNEVKIGGGFGEVNTATLIRFFTASNTTTTVGTEALKLDSAGKLFSTPTQNNTTGAGANVFISAGQFYRSTSSQRYKNTINDATHGLTELLALRPVTYKGDNDGDTIYGGLIAEEVHDAGLTEFVEYTQDDDGNDQPESLFYGNMVSLCIKAIQELKAELDAAEVRIETLETKVTTLETENADFETRIAALENVQ